MVDGSGALRLVRTGEWKAGFSVLCTWVMAFCSVAILVYERGNPFNMGRITRLELLRTAEMHSVYVAVKFDGFVLLFNMVRNC